MIKRKLQNSIQQHLFKGKAILLFGSRQTGKTTLVEQIANETGIKTSYLNADESDIREMLTQTTSTLSVNAKNT